MVVDHVDRHLVALLAEDGRRSNTDIASRLGVSEATVRQRVQRLTASGVIQIVALCNPLALGHQSVRLLISVRALSPRAVARILSEMPMIGHIALVAGVHDIYVEATCRDLDQLIVLLDDIRAVPGIVRIDQAVLTQLYKDYSWIGLRGHGKQKAVGGSAGIEGGEHAPQ